MKEGKNEAIYFEMRNCVSKQIKVIYGQRKKLIKIPRVFFAVFAERIKNNQQNGKEINETFFELRRPSADDDDEWLGFKIYGENGTCRMSDVAFDFICFLPQWKTRAINKELENCKPIKHLCLLVSNLVIMRSLYLAVHYVPAKYCVIVVWNLHSRED